MGAVLALTASALWGSGDFLGGTLSRRAHPLSVMRAAQALALVGLLVIAAVAGELDAGGYVPWGVAAGLAGCVALGCFYAALAEGTMGVVAPVAATGVVVPVGIGLAAGESPELLQLLGIALAVVGVILACGPGGERRATSSSDGAEGTAPPAATLRPLLLSAVAALGFGVALVLVAEGAEHSVIMTLVTMRAVNAAVATVVLTVVVQRATHPRRDDVPTLALIGVTDAGANGAYAVASTMSLVSVSAVLASLYPAVTALLAWRFHREQLTVVQVVGVAATLGGVGLIAAGSA